MTISKLMPVTVLRGGKYNVPKNDDIIVLKAGGSTLDELSDQFFTNIKKLQQAGFKPILVHGGGPAIEEVLKKEKIQTEFVNGLRKTTKEVMDVVEMVLTGVTNNKVTRKLNQCGIQAVGLSGSDMNLLRVHPIDFEQYGYVGEVTKVNVHLIHSLLKRGIVPVIAPIGVDEKQNVYNVNADTAAGAVAKALSAKQLIFVTDVPGIMKDGKLLECVTEKEVEEMIADGTIYGGMIPKVKAALNSLGGYLEEAMIIDGNQSVLTTKEQAFVGTVIQKTVGVSKHVSTLSNV